MNTYAAPLRPEGAQGCPPTPRVERVSALLRPEGAQGCSHGCSAARVLAGAAQPVEEDVEGNTRPRGAEERPPAAPDRAPAGGAGGRAGPELYDVLMPDLTEAIRQFDATEANLKRLEELWKEIEALIPSGMVIDKSSPGALRYAELCRTFRHIRTFMPKVDGFELTDALLDLDAVFMNRMDAKECGEISAEIGVEREIYSQGETLREYRFRFSAQRRVLVRTALADAILGVDNALSILASFDAKDAAAKITGEAWEDLKRHIAEIDVLRGTAVKEPPRWNDLRRHLGFGLAQDLLDILKHDWPAAKPSLQAAMYGPDDPLPVAVADLGSLVKAAPTGPVVTALKWDQLDDECFERLVYNLVSDAPSYSNAQWLTHTRAPDRGRDISVTRTTSDPLSGTRVHRIIIQCRRWTTKSIAVSDIATLKEHMASWAPPKVDELVIATTGRFSIDAVAAIEKHNAEKQTPLITMWPDSHLESLLAARPHLVAQFRLR